MRQVIRRSHHQGRDVTDIHSFGLWEVVSGPVGRGPDLRFPRQPWVGIRDDDRTPKKASLRRVPSPYPSHWFSHL
jgi:hypothetical protein